MFYFCQQNFSKNYFFGVKNCLFKYFFLKFILILTMSFSQNLRNLLFYNEIKASDLSRRTGINYNTILSYLNKGCIPRADYAMKIANYLNVSVEYLLTGVEIVPEAYDKYPTASELRKIPKRFQASLKKIIHELSLVDKL